jgi:hypothetical protein
MYASDQCVRDLGENFLIMCGDTLVRAHIYIMVWFSLAIYNNLLVIIETRSNLPSSPLKAITCTQIKTSFSSLNSVISKRFVHEDFVRFLSINKR